MQNLQSSYVSDMTRLTNMVETLTTTHKEELIKMNKERLTGTTHQTVDDIVNILGNSYNKDIEGFDEL